MKITLNLENLEELSKIKIFALEKGLTIDQVIDAMIKKAASNLKTKNENQISPEDVYRAKLDQYVINDFIKEKLKFRYFLLKDRNCCLCSIQ